MQIVHSSTSTIINIVGVNHFFNVVVKSAVETEKSDFQKVIENLVINSGYNVDSIVGDYFSKAMNCSKHLNQKNRNLSAKLVQVTCFSIVHT